MAECELRQRKKEEDGEYKPEETNEKIKSIGQDQVQTEIKTETVRFILNFVIPQYDSS